MYALHLFEKTNRIAAACKILDGRSYDGMPIVDTLPEGDISDYLYMDGQYIHNPLPEPDPPEPETEPSVWDELDAAYQAGYTEGYQEGVNTAYDDYDE